MYIYEEFFYRRLLRLDEVIVFELNDCGVGWSRIGEDEDFCYLEQYLVCFESVGFYFVEQVFFCFLVLEVCRNVVVVGCELFVGYGD